MQLNESSVLITGATGFIGSRLAQWLARETRARITGVGRNLQAVAHVRQDGVALAQADLLDMRAMRRLVEGQDVIFHLAGWMGRRHGEREMAWVLNVFAVQRLVKMAADSGVSRFVHVSSIAAYGPPQLPVLAESQPLALRQESIYGRTKAEGERKALETGKEVGLDVAVVRPGFVYGPGSFGWSRRMVQLVKRGIPVLFGEGHGHAHPVYIDNLLLGMMQAATHPEAAGQAFNFVDGPVTWREWFGRYGHMCGREPRQLPLWLARLALVVVQYVPLGFSVDRDMMAYYTSKTVIPDDKARRLLHYEPAVDLDEGMRRTEDWLRQEGVL